MPKICSLRRCCKTLAVPLLAKELPNDYVDLLEGRHGGTFHLSELERARFGWTHSEAAGIMGARMETAGVVRGINRHALPISRHWLHATSKIPRTRPSACLRSCLPPCDEQWAERDKFAKAYQSLAGPGCDPLASVFEKVDVEFAEFAPVMKLGTPAQPLAERLEESTIHS